LHQNQFLKCTTFYVPLGADKYQELQEVQSSNPMKRMVEKRPIAGIMECVDSNRD
ncbi:Uncharacterized protein APZ42_009307, partial [Daphnia magna]